jgi:hypothetical protein
MRQCLYFFVRAKDLKAMGAKADGDEQRLDAAI